MNQVKLIVVLRFRNTKPIRIIKMLVFLYCQFEAFSQLQTCDTSHQDRRVACSRFHSVNSYATRILCKIHNDSYASISNSPFCNTINLLSRNRLSISTRPDFCMRFCEVLKSCHVELFLELSDSLFKSVIVAEE